MHTPAPRALSPVALRLLGPAAVAALTESGRQARERARRAGPARAGDAEKIESGRLQRDVGRTRLLPFDLVLTRASGALPVFRAGPFDELKLYQRAVDSTHDTEWLQRAAPGDLDRERYQPHGVFRLRPERALRVPDLATSPRLVAALRAALGPAGVLGPRRWFDVGPGAGAGGVGAGELRPGRSGALRRPGAAPDPGVLDAARARLDDRQRLAWLESAFAPPPADGGVVHRYYLGTHLQAYLVRHDAQGKRLFLAEPAAAARGHGLIVYLRGRAA